MMKRIRHNLANWDEGKAFMNRLADEFGTTIEQREENLKVKTENLTVSCHLDPREFAFITIKLENESMEPRIRELLSRFKQKEE